MRNVIQLCLAANNILLMHKANHSFLFFSPSWAHSCVKMADRFTSGSCSAKNKFIDWLINQLLNSIISKYFNLSVCHMSINPQHLPSADWSNGHRQIMIFFLNLLSWLLRGSSCLTDLTQSTKVLLPLEGNKICVSIAAKICHQVKPEFPLSPVDDNYTYPIIDYYC